MRYIQLDGSGGFIGNWQTTTSLPNNPLVTHQVLFRNGRLYLIGGQEGSPDYINHSDIYYTTINSNGTLGAWTATTALPAARSSFAAVIWPAPNNTDYLYVVGGDQTNLSGQFTAQPEVYYAPFNPDGTLGAFAAPKTLPAALGGHGMVRNTAQVFVTGGAQGSSHQTVLNTVQSALLDPNTGLADLDFVPGPPEQYWNSADALPEARVYHGTVINSFGHVYVIGGTGPGGAFARDTIFRGATFALGSNYAPSGDFTSRPFSLDGATQLQSLAWNTRNVNLANNTNITLQYRVANSAAELLTTTWTTLGASQAGTNVTSSVAYTSVVIGRYFQYKALFATGLTSTTPILNNVELTYLKPTPPDLSVFKTDNQTLASPGQILTYTIRYTNTYAGPVSGVFLSETLPPFATFVGPAGWTAQGNNTYWFNVGTMQADATGIATFAIQVNNSVPLTLTSIVNRVSIDYDRTFGPDPNPGDNVSTDTDTLRNVDLEIKKGNGTNSLIAGQITTYTLTYRNLGSDTATGVVITDVIAGGLVIPPGGPGAGWVQQPDGSYQYTVGTVPANGFGTVTFVAQVPIGINGGTWLYNRAGISFAGSDDPLNNFVEDGDYVFLPNLDVFKDDGTAIAAPNQSLSYQIVATNRGGVNAQGVVITETPSTLVTVSSNPGWTQVGSSYVFNIGTLLPLESRTLTFNVTVLGSAPLDSLITNTVRIGGSNEDPQGLNDNVATDTNLVTPNAPDIVITLVEPTKLFATVPTGFLVTVRNDGLAATRDYFFVDLYTSGQRPANRLQQGNTYGLGGNGLAVGATTQIAIGAITFDSAGAYQLWLQADTCNINFVGPGQECFDRSYGRIPEINEANNIFGPFTVTVLPPPAGRIYLPLMFK